MYKILVIGDSATGKTSLVNSFVHRKFDPLYRATIACDFSLKIIQINGHSLRVQLWDIAGQDRLQGMTKLFCRGASGAIVVADVTRLQTLEHARNWKERINQIMISEEQGSIPLVLALNKYDLVEEEKIELDPHLQMEYLTEFQKQNDFTGVAYTSAKTNFNIEEVIMMLLSEVIRRGGKSTSLQISSGKDSMLTKSTKGTQQKKRGCCQ